MNQLESLPRKRRRRSAVLAACVVVATLLGAVPPAASARLKPDVVQSRYRQVLSLLASGEREKALEELFALETEVVGIERPGRRIENFWRLKLKVVRELLASQPLEILVPVVVLHHDAYRMYRQRDEPFLASHSRSMSSELAEVYAQRADARGAKLFAGWVMTSFGSYLQDSMSNSAAAGFFRRALDFDPGNQVALLGLAAAHEKSAEYPEAIEHLEREIGINPEHHEARLRLALCRIRTPALLSDGVGNLEQLVAGQAPDWIRSVAYQELAKVRLRAGEGQRAERVLRDGLGALPGDQQLSVQLASLLDAARRPKEALQVLTDIRSNGWEADSPRRVYDSAPTAGIDEARKTLREMMASRLVPLRAGLLFAEPQVQGE